MALSKLEAHDSTLLTGSGAFPRIKVQSGSNEFQVVVDARSGRRMRVREQYARSGSSATIDESRGCRFS